MVFLLPGYKTKKELVFPCLKVSNKLRHDYWSAHIYVGFASLLHPPAWLCIFHRRSWVERIRIYISLPFVQEVCHCAWKSSPSRPLGGARLHAAPTSVWSADVFLSFCWAQRRKELITYFERFMSYYRTTPTAHLLSCAFICLLLY